VKRGGGKRGLKDTGKSAAMGETELRLSAIIFRLARKLKLCHTPGCVYQVTDREIFFSLHFDDNLKRQIRQLRYLTFDKKVKLYPNFRFFNMFFAKRYYFYSKPV